LEELRPVSAAKSVLSVLSTLADWCLAARSLVFGPISVQKSLRQSAEYHPSQPPPPPKLGATALQMPLSEARLPLHGGGQPDALAQAMLLQSRALTSLVSLPRSNGYFDRAGGYSRAVELQADLAQQDGAFFRAVVSSAARRMDPSALNLQPGKAVDKGLSLCRYLERYEAYQSHREYGLLQWTLARALDQASAGSPQRALDTVALAMVMIEQWTLDQGKTELGWWVAIALAEVKELDVLSTKRLEVGGVNPSRSRVSKDHLLVMGHGQLASLALCWPELKVLLLPPFSPCRRLALDALAREQPNQAQLDMIFLCVPVGVVCIWFLTSPRSAIFLVARASFLLLTLVQRASKGTPHLVSTGHWDIQPFLSPELWMPFVETKELMLLWDSRGLLRLQPGPFAPRELCRVFAAFKSPENDRMIGDRQMLVELSAKRGCQVLVGPPFSLRDLASTRAYASLLADLASRRAASREGDHLGVEFATQAVVIDDFFSISTASLAEVPPDTAPSDALLQTDSARKVLQAKAAYRKHELKGSDHKDVVGALTFKVAGASVDSSLATVADGHILVSAPIEKRLSLVFVSLQAARKAAGDLALLAALIPVMCSDVTTPFEESVFCSDSSLSKGAFCEAPVGERISSALWRSADKRGHSEPLAPAHAAAEASAQVLADPSPRPAWIEEPTKASLSKPLAMHYDFLEVFGGSRPVSAALRERGRSNSLVLDLSVSRQFDLASPRALEWILYLVQHGRVRSVFLSPPCTTFSVASWPSVRSHSVPWGFDLRDPKTFRGNKTACVAMLILRSCYCYRVPALLEQPLLSKMLWLPPFKAFLDLPGPLAKASAVYTPKLAVALAEVFLQALSSAPSSDTPREGLENVGVNDILLHSPWVVSRSWSWKKQKHINRLETDAAVNVLRTLALRGGDRRFALLVDSTAAKGALVKGRSAARLLRHSLRRAAALQIAAALYPAFHFAPTRLNASDAPTRDTELAEPSPLSVLQDLDTAATVPAAAAEEGTPLWPTTRPSASQEKGLLRTALCCLPACCVCVRVSLACHSFTRATQPMLPV
ncbi:unnamed protein product, partial [Symbiodinium necroappetens]